MAKRSSLMQLPDDLRAKLNKQLVASGFSNYDALADWLDAELEERDLEFKISRSAIHRHGQKFEEKIERLRIATEQAKAISEGSEDDAGAMNDALIRLVQTKTFDTLMELDDDESAPVNLQKIGIMVARLTNASVRQKEWAMEARQKLTESKQAAAEKVEQLTRDHGLSSEVANEIRGKILGIKLD